MRDLYEFRHVKEREHALDSMRGYLQNKPEQVKFFEELVGPYLKESDVSVLDACCGMGDLTFFLSELNPNAVFTGVDKASFLIDEARRNFPGNPNISFQQGDLYELSKQFGEKSFDLSVCKQTLSWLPGYEPAVRELMSVTRRAVFISSLFYDGRIDFETRVREHTTDAGRDGYNAFYNVYSFPIFREFCLSQGARDVVGFNFKIGIDLPRPVDPDRMGTYTLPLQSGERLQISGALLMPWKIVRIDL
jgi:ubiquinone/menaquinone biosynthesis C-methylase UbiE